jgi:N-acetylmuramoyl-L-alanine amidase
MGVIFRAVLLTALVFGASVESRAAEPARVLYQRALVHERTLRDGASAASLADFRAAVKDYEAIVRRYPASAYSDNALWQGANVALLAFQRFGQPADQKTAVRLLTQLREQYPASSLIARIDETLRQPAAAPPAVASAPAAAAEVETAPPPPADGSPAEQGAAPGIAAIRDIKRTSLPDGVRISIELDNESVYHAERLENPRRVFFDLRGTRAVPALQDATLKFPDSIVREIRLGRHPKNITRIVMDMEGAESYSVFSLYNPFRLVIDFKSATAGTAGTVAPAAAPVEPPAKPEPVVLVPSLPTPPPSPAATIASRGPGLESDAAVVLSRPSAPLPPPAVPAANSDGKFSLARQLGLGISRIVIDPGHGGHDPGAQANGVNEAELVLDVAQRLSRLVRKQTSIDVVMTRDADVFIPLEERTAIANRADADLFLSIHANASRNLTARGIETYFLNFASNPGAEAVAARENSGSGRTMHNLPDIVRAIALNNKLNESRDFAEMVQHAMTSKLAARGRAVKDLGVKHAPFVVLIGAIMPSVLAEISFVTNRQEGQWLKTAAYRQQIAEALLDAVLQYQQSLKKLKSSGTSVGARGPNP